MFNIVFDELFRLMLLVLLLLFKLIWLILLNWYCCCWIWSCNELAFWKLCKFNCCCDVNIGALNGALIDKFKLFCWLLILLLLLLLLALWKLFNNVDLFCENGDWLRFKTGKSDGSNGENSEESAVSILN